MNQGFFKRNLSCILSALALYLSAVFAGMFFGVQAGAKDVLSQETSPAPGIFFIKNNLGALTLSYLGFLSFGFTTVILLALNGIDIGGILSLAPRYLFMSSIVARFFPHGLFEIPGILFAGAAGLKMPQVLIRHLRGGDFVIKQDVKDYFALVVISVILVVIAGFVEANITPAAIKLVD